MWKKTEHIVENNQAIQYKIYENGKILTWNDIIEYWINNPQFRIFYNSILKNCPYDAFFWENPGISESELNTPYEFVIINSDYLTETGAESGDFEEYFNTEKPIVVFPNYSGDATLVVPTPMSDEKNYPHIAAFVQQAPEDQIDKLWQKVGSIYKNSLSFQEKWLSTSGLGVYWLHIRIDSSPKYYNFIPYT